MARKPGPGRCVHCLGHFEKRNWDHVFPRAWYPDTTPLNLYKWQVPSCKHCNEAYGELETDLLIRISLCLDPTNPDTASIVQRGLRAIDPGSAHSQSDRRSRDAKRKQLLHEMREDVEIPSVAIYPNFGLNHGETTVGRAVILVPADGIRRLAEKIVRGITFIHDEQFIESYTPIDFFALSDDGAKPLLKVLSDQGETFARGPGIVVQRVLALENNVSAIYSIIIFDKFKMYVTVGVDS